MATDKVDMSLDDIIKMNKRSKQTPSKNGPASGRRGANFNSNQKSSNVVRNNQSRNIRRTNPYSRPAPVKSGERWKHDLFDGSNKPTRLMIGNLHFRVSDNDIKELFKEFGIIKRAAVHYDKSGRSLGNAEVVFASKMSAHKALEKYNDVLLDGRKMKITLVSDKPVAATAPQANSRPRKPMGSRLGAGQQNNNGARARNNPQKGKQAGGRPAQQPKATKEQLDAELEAYVSKN